MIEESFRHIPVLVKPLLDNFTFSPDKRPLRLIDGTVGGGGHSRLLLERYANLELLGIDRDEMALAAAERTLAFAGSRVKLVRGDYADMAAIAADNKWDQVDGILLDIGVSSPQLDTPERGFSWRADGPLDMRMDNRNPLTAARWLNRSSEDELIRVFRDYGELHRAKALAAAVIERRQEKPFAMCSDLVALSDAVLGRARPGKLPHPTLLFQAVRIAVNDELGQLERALNSTLPLLYARGLIAVISFHSLEDRIVKNFFRRESTDCLCPPGLPICCCHHRAALKIVTRHVLIADDTELSQNRRAACAKLRIAEKL